MVDSSMTLIILFFVTALLFVGVFSIYIRYSSAVDEEHDKGRGLDKSAVNSLPILAYDKAAKHRITDECSICLSEFHEGESVKLIPNCGHVFHPRCVDTWLTSHVTCPMCRSAQLFGRGGEEVCLDVARCRNDNSCSDLANGSCFSSE